MENLLVILLHFTKMCPRKGFLTSSLVVRLEATRYVWKPDRPKMDQIEKKQITSSTAVENRVKEHIEKAFMSEPSCS